MASTWRRDLAEAVRSASGEAEPLAKSLERLLSNLQRANGLRTFGVCRTCRFFEREGKGRFRCGLTTEPLSEDDSRLVCREHEGVTA